MAWYELGNFLGYTQEEIRQEEAATDLDTYMKTTHGVAKSIVILMCKATNEVKMKGIYIIYNKTCL
jgi:hypothetical protein